MPLIALNLVKIWEPPLCPQIACPSPNSLHNLNFMASFILEVPASVLYWKIIFSRKLFFCCSLFFLRSIVWPGKDTRTQVKS